MQHIYLKDVTFQHNMIILYTINYIEDKFFLTIADLT